MFIIDNILYDYKKHILNLPRKFIPTIYDYTYTDKLIIYSYVDGLDIYKVTFDRYIEKEEITLIPELMYSLSDKVVCMRFLHCDSHHNVQNYSQPDHHHSALIIQTKNYAIINERMYEGVYINAVYIDKCKIILPRIGSSGVIFELTDDFCKYIYKDVVYIKYLKFTLIHKLPYTVKYFMNCTLVVFNNIVLYVIDNIFSIVLKLKQRLQVEYISEIRMYMNFVNISYRNKKYIYNYFSDIL